MAKVGETLVWNGQRPWDQFGSDISNEMTADEMMRKADLDWQVIKSPMTFRDADGVEHSTSQDVLYREGRPEHPLTYVPRDNWNILQNNAIFDFFEPWVESGDLRLLSCGSIKHGALVWVLAEIGSEIEVTKGDRMRNNILFTLPHLYGKAIDIRQTPYRMSCNNMIALALGRNNENLTIRWQHNKKFDPDVVSYAFKLADSQFQHLRETGTRLSRISYSEDDLEAYLHDLFPSKSQQDDEKLSLPARQVMSYLDTQPGAELAYGTWWQVVQGVTFCTNHVLGRSAEQRLNSLWYSTHQRTNIRAIELALQYSRL